MISLHKLTAKGRKMENIKDVIAEVRVIEGVGRESGKPYRQLALVFTNGYEKRIFLDSAEWFVVDELTGDNKGGKINVKSGD